VIGPRRASLTGRGPELAALAQAVASARRGSGGLVLVSGEAGVGKSRLCREFAAAVDGAVQLRGQAYPGDRVVANAILVDTLRTARRDAACPLWPAALGHAAVLGTVVPELLDESGGGAALDDEAHVFETVLDVVAEAAGERPVIWLAEDVQWADPASWRFLQYCVRRTPSMRLLMLCTFRDDEAMPDDQAWTRFSVLGPRDGLARLRLGRLSPADSESVARELCGDSLDEAAVQAVAERSGGTPLLVEELAAMYETLGAGAGGVPEVIQATARERSRIAGESAQGLLQLAAVMGHDADLDLLVDLRPDQAPAVEPLVAAGLLRPLTEAGRAGTVEFRHPLLREAVYEGIPWEHRRRLHAEAADALTEHASSQSVERVAQHWELAGRPERALEALVHVIGQARRQGNLNRSVGLGRLALELVERHERLAPQRATVVEPLIEDLVAQGAYQDAQPLLPPAWQAAAPGSPARQQLTAMRALVEWYLGSPVERLIRMVEDELAGPVEKGSREEAMLCTVGGVIWHAYGDARRSGELSERGRRAAVASGDVDIEGRAMVHRAWLRAVDVHQCAAIVAELRDLAHHLRAAGAHAREASVLLQVARGTLDEADMERAEKVGQTWNPWCALGARVLRAHVAVFAGRLADAEPALREAEARLDERSQALWYVRVVRATAALMQGRYAEAAARLAENEASYRSDTVTEGADTQALAGWLCLEEGDVEGAAAAFEVALQALDYTRLEPGMAAGPWFIALQVDALLRGGQADQAARVLARTVERERDPDMDRYTAASLLAAELRLEPTPERLRAAVEAAAEPWPWLAGLCQVWGARLLGDREAARAAADTWRRLGYQPGVERAERLLGSLGRGGTGAARVLTAREEMVAALIAEGLTNAQIAERLHISPVTVAHHVSSVLDKLGVSSRTQVAVLLTRGDAGR